MSLQWEEQVFEKIQAQVVAKVRPFEPVGRTAFLSGSNSNTPTHPAQRELCCWFFGPGGCTALRSDSNSNMLTHPARRQVDSLDIFELETRKIAQYTDFIRQVASHERNQRDDVQVDWRGLAISSVHPLYVRNRFNRVVLRTPNCRCLADRSQHSKYGHPLALWP